VAISPINLGTDNIALAISNTTSASNGSSVNKAADSGQQNAAEVQDASIQSEQLDRALNSVNQALSYHRIRFEYTVHDKTKAVMIKMMDADTGEVIREIPPEKFLDIEAMTLEQAGLLVDKKA
jgi:Uncharacterized flagellar protein FlaG